MGETKVSVIIPVYNVEKYLNQCMDSVVNQTLKEIEIICVDDGSTDSSLKILKEYSDRDPRVQIYTQHNQYAGVARNNGMKHAHGEYLIFWDSDDFFELNALEVMYKKAVKYDADLCVCDCIKYHEDIGTYDNVQNILKRRMLPEGQTVFSGSDNEQHPLSFTTMVPWNKLINREFVTKNELQFEAISNGNDWFFIAMVLCLAEKTVVVEERLIYYRIRQSGSITSTTNSSNGALVHTMLKAADELRKRNVFPKRSFGNKAIGSLVYMFRNMSTFSAQKTAYDIIQGKGPDALGIINSPYEGYYHTKWFSEVAEHLNSDTAEDFISFLLNLTYKQDEKHTIAKRKAIEEKKALKNSRSYRLGRFILRIPSKIKKGLRREK